VFLFFCIIITNMGGTAVTSPHYTDEVFFVVQKNKEVVIKWL